MVSKVKYNGKLSTSATHLKSGATIITDAPLDNQGLGNSFSPTDSVATALATCMFTIMGIKARDKDWSIEASTANVSKVMGSNPRRITEIYVEFEMKHHDNNSNPLDHKAQTILEGAAKTCPVFYSIHPDIVVQTRFNW